MQQEWSELARNPKTKAEGCLTSPKEAAEEIQDT
jgi:hypothetical protein